MRLVGFNPVEFDWTIAKAPRWAGEKSGERGLYVKKASNLEAELEIHIQKVGSVNTMLLTVLAKQRKLYILKHPETCSNDSVIHYILCVP